MEPDYGRVGHVPVDIVFRVGKIFGDGLETLGLVYQCGDGIVFWGIRVGVRGRGPRERILEFWNSTT